jgi:hypothetical protein
MAPRKGSLRNAG